MAIWYFEELSSLMEKIGVGKSTHNRLQCQHFFSGAACYVDNKIFASKLVDESIKYVQSKRK